MRITKHEERTLLDDIRSDQEMLKTAGFSATILFVLAVAISIYRLASSDDNFLYNNAWIFSGILFVMAIGGGIVGGVFYSRIHKKESELN